VSEAARRAHSDAGLGVRRGRALACGALVGAAALGMLAANAARYHPFLSDDALISLRYARRLLDGHGLSWTDGPPVEGYSNLLWILLVAGLGALGVDLVDAARVLGLLGGALTIAALLRTWPARSLPEALPAAAGAFAFALAAPIGAWTVGGLEQPLVGALLAWATVLLFPVVEGRAPARAGSAAALCLALLCIARPDGALFAAGAAAAVALGAGSAGGLRGRARAALALGLLPALFVAGQLAFRLAYYGEWLPNPALVKLSPSSHHLWGGLRYVGRGLLALSPLSQGLLLVAAAGASGLFGAGPARSARLRLLLVQASLWLVYVAAVGGDIFPAYRHFVPVVVLASFAAADGVAWLLERRPARRVRAALAAGLAAALAAFAFAQTRLHESQRAIAERFEWRGQVVGLALARAFGEAQPLVAVTAAGCIPYWSQLPSLDMLGLNDHHIARRRPQDFGRGRLAHELGDGAYVLSRAPDLIVYHVGNVGSEFRSGRELAAMPEYHAAYAPVALEASDPFEHRFVVWVRRESVKLGLRRSEHAIAVPGHLLAANGVGVARPGADGRFEAVLGARSHALVEALALGAGRWRVEADATGPVIARVRDARTGEVLADGPTPLRVEIEAPTERSVDLLLFAPPMAQVRVREARLVQEHAQGL
jgi:hypothetical protein